MTPVLSEFGTDPAGVAASGGFDLRVLGDPENAIPLIVAGKLLQVSALQMGCAHFGLLLGQQNDTRTR